MAMKKGMRITWVAGRFHTKYHGRIVEVYPWGVMAVIDESGLTAVPVRSNLITLEE